MFADEYFDPDMKRFISVEDMWNRNLKNVLRCAADVKRRCDDLKELQCAINETVSVLSLREQHAVRSIQEETETIIAQIRRRESDLIGLIAGDAFAQRQKLELIANRVRDHSATLRKEVQVMMNVAPTMPTSPDRSIEPNPDAPTSSVSVKQRFTALTVCEKVLGESCFYAIPETFACTVVTRPINVDQFLNVTKIKCASAIPSTLTIVAKENKFYCPLPNTTNRPATGTGLPSPRDVSGSGSVVSSHPGGATSVVGDAMLRGNSAGLPLGICHYLATQGGRAVFKNPVEEDLIRITCTIPLQVGSLHQLLYDRSSGASCSAGGDAAPLGLRTKSVSGGRIAFDFSDRRRVRLEAYLLQHGHKDEHAALRNWAVEGSNDGADWITLDRQTECKLLGLKPFNEATFVVSSLAFAKRGQSTLTGTTEGTTHVAPATDDDTPSFRYLSIVSTGGNAAGEDLHHIELARVEFFGTVVVG